MSYDAVGNLLSVSDETGATSYAYDERDRLVKETFPGNQVLQHAYDAASNRASLTYPDGVKALFACDAANRLTSVTDRAGAKTTYTYDALDHPTRISYPSGAGETYTYDPLGKMTRATATDVNSTGSTVVLSQLTYAYDKSSNPTSITDKAGKQSTFTYDPLDRMTKEVHPDRTLTYAYDAAGNRTSMTQGTTTTNYTYDYEGNLTKAGAKTYTRDAFGWAVSATSETTTTNYLFDGMEVVQEEVGTNAPTYYTRGLEDQLISRRGGGYALKYYHHDSVGSVVALTNNAGELTDTYSYTAFGEVRARTDTDAQPFQYVVG